jgi:hypothetical protein
LLACREVRVSVRTRLMSRRGTFSKKADGHAEEAHFSVRKRLMARRGRFFYKEKVDGQKRHIFL